MVAPTNTADRPDRCRPVPLPVCARSRAGGCMYFFSFLRDAATATAAKREGWVGGRGVAPIEDKPRPMIGSTEHARTVRRDVAHSRSQ